jgi:large subunit ribosomal protein L10
MPNLINKMIVRELTSAFSDAEGMVIVSLAGLSVEESEGLRDSLAEHGVQLRMVRNRLARIALRESGIEVPDDLLAGNVAVAWGNPEETIHAAKVLHESNARKAGKVAMRGGLLDGEVLGPDGAKALADLPGKDELRAMILGALSGPARGLVGVLAATPSGLARVLQARIDEGGFTGEAAAPAAEEAPSAEEAPAEEAPADDSAPAEDDQADEA